MDSDAVAVQFLVKPSFLAFSDVATVGCLVLADLAGHAGISVPVTSLPLGVDLAILDSRIGAILLPLEAPVDLAHARMSGHNFISTGRSGDYHQYAHQHYWKQKETSHL